MPPAGGMARAGPTHDAIEAVWRIESARVIAGLAKVVHDVGLAGGLADYPQLPAVRGDLLARLGRHEEARLEFERAAARTKNERERTIFLDRAAGCARDAAAR